MVPDDNTGVGCVTGYRAGLTSVKEEALVKGKQGEGRKSVTRRGGGGEAGEEEEEWEGKRRHRRRKEKGRMNGKGRGGTGGGRRR